MLIKFTVENWKSFRDPATLNMIATDDDRDKERLAKIEEYDIHALPVAAIYGGNASGKSNFFSAIAFAKHFVLSVPGLGATIPIDRFSLDPEYAGNPVKFIFDILIDKKIYNYTFVVTHTEVKEERLTEIGSHENEDKVLYDRFADDGNIFKKDQRLQFILEGTRKNQLFLTNSVSQNHDAYKDVYDWFSRLIFIFPNTRFPYFSEFIEGGTFHDDLNETLADLDTGISKLGGENIPWNQLPVLEDERQSILEYMAEHPHDQHSYSPPSRPNDRYIVYLENGKPQAKKLYTYHRDNNGKDQRFEIAKESDGTRRLLDILPGLLTLAVTKTPFILIIDELDRRLHSRLTQKLLAAFLSVCSATTRKQLLVTTHDIMSITRLLFRTDEMWRTERDKDGASELVSFSEYDGANEDEDIRMSYYQGRMGGIPDIQYLDWQTAQENDGK